MTLPALLLTGAALLASPMISPAPGIRTATLPRVTRTAPAPAAIARAAFVARLDSGFASLDANRDGKVTSGEIAAAEARARIAADAAALAHRHEAFARLDTNRDGQLSQAEFDAAAAPRPAAPEAVAVVARLDSDRDQRLSLAEYRAPALARFDRADANRDGIVTPEEDRAAAKPR